MLYERVQTTRWWPLLLIPIGGVLLATAVFAEPLPGVARVLIVAAAALFGWLLITFSRLTVRVGEGEIRVWFGAGWPRRRIGLVDVLAHRRTRNRWWYGFGIRWYPGGTLWNVAGLDAVELDLTSGRRFRVGTDDPDGLAMALTSATGRSVDDHDLG